MSICHLRIKWSLIFVCLFMDLYYVPQKKKRNILSIQLNGWITSKNYQLSRDNKNWDELNIWPSLGKGLTGHCDHIVSVLQMYCSFISQMYHASANHRAFAQTITFLRKTFSSFPASIFMLIYFWSSSNLRPVYSRVTFSESVQYTKSFFESANLRCNFTFSFNLERNVCLYPRLLILLQQRYDWFCSSL